MYVVQLLCQGYVLVVPTVLCGFIATYQQHSTAPKILGIQHSIRPSCMLYSQLPQIAVSSSLDIAAMGKAQPRPEQPQQINTGSHRRLLLCIQAIPPLFEFIRVFNVPDHANMPPKEYKLKCITLGRRRLVASRVPEEIVFTSFRLPGEQ